MAFHTVGSTFELIHEDSKQSHSSIINPKLSGSVRQTLYSSFMLTRNDHRHSINNSELLRIHSQRDRHGNEGRERERVPMQKRELKMTK